MDIAEAKLSTRESLIREIKERVTTELVSDYGKERGRVLSGALGEQIAIAAGSLNLNSYVTPEQVAAGVCTWLDKYFLQPPQDFDPRADVAPCSSSGVPSKTSEGGGDGCSRVAALDSHRPVCGQDVVAEAVV